MSSIEVDKIVPATGTSLTLGDSGDTFTIPSGVTLTNNGTASGFGGAFEGQLLHVQDQKANGTDGDSLTAGSWQTRTLNTIKTNEITGASLSSNQISLPSGTYYIIAKANLFDGNRHKIKLRNITDSSDEIIGSSEFSHSSYQDASNSYLNGRFTINASKTFEIQHRSESSATLGIGSIFGVIEVFADVQIWKVA